MGTLKKTVLLIAVVAASAGAHAKQQGAGTAGRQASKAIDPQADRMLKQMTNYLASLRSLRVVASSLDEVVTKSGQKVEIANESQVTVERPNRLRSEQLGPGHRMAFWYDGKTMTLYCQANNTYGTVPAPSKIDATIDHARSQYKVEAPGADLLYSRPYDVLTEQVRAGKFIGRETIDGVAVNHLAFEGEEVDWQIWIEDGPQPLPRRYEITSKTVTGQPEFSVRLSHWEPNVNVAASTFEFRPPAGATRAPSLPTSCGAPR